MCGFYGRRIPTASRLSCGSAWSAPTLQVRAQRFSHCCTFAERVRLGNAALRQTRSPRRIVPRHRCGQPRSPVRPTAPLISHNDRWGMWLSTTGSSALGQPSTNTARSEDSFRHPPTHSDYRRIRRPDARGCRVGYLETRRARERKTSVDFAASEYRSTRSKNTLREKQQMSRHRPRPPRSSSKVQVATRGAALGPAAHAQGPAEAARTTDAAAAAAAAPRLPIVRTPRRAY